MPDQTFMNEKRLFSKGGRRQRTFFDGGGEGLWKRFSLSIYLAIFWKQVSIPYAVLLWTWFSNIRRRKIVTYCMKNVRTYVKVPITIFFDFDQEEAASF